MVQDHVHMLIKIPPKYSVAEVVGYIKGKSAIAVARQFGGRQKTSMENDYGLVGMQYQLLVLRKLRRGLTSSSRSNSTEYRAVRKKERFNQQRRFAPIFVKISFAERSLGNLSFYALRFENCSFCEASLERCGFTQVSFSSCNFQRTTWNKPEIAACHFRSCLFQGSWIEEGTILSSVFDSSPFEHANYYKCQIFYQLFFEQIERF